MNTENTNAHLAAGGWQAVQVQGPTLRPYLIQIKNGSTVRLEFAAMAPDSLTAAEQHQCLCERHEYVRVMPASATDEAREAMREHAALCRQVQANRHDPLLTGLY